MSRPSHRQFLESEILPAPAEALAGDELSAAFALVRRRFEATFLHAPVGIAHVALDGGFLLVNPRFCEISGYDVATLKRTGFQQITHPDDLNADEALLARLNAREIPRYTMEKRYIRPDGTVIWVNLTVAMVLDGADQPEFYVAVIEDLSELRQASFEAGHDPLTGLLNRRGLACRARDIVADAGRTGDPISLLVLDLDGFKQLNDHHGHVAGDKCLVEVGKLLSCHAGPQDAVARMGGDEFLMLLNGLDADAAGVMGEYIRAGLAMSCSGPIHVSGSFGLATFPARDVVDFDLLVASADAAMLAAKRMGKNQIRVAHFH